MHTGEGCNGHSVLSVGAAFQRWLTLNSGMEYELEVDNNLCPLNFIVVRYVFSNECVLFKVCC